MTDGLRHTQKRSVDELAVFGGSPLFPSPLHTGLPNTPDRQRFFARLNDLLDRRWLTNNGVYLTEFERQVAAIAGTSHCVAVCNGTIGLQILVRALGLKGEVILPSFTFVSTAHALLWEGVTPVFADIAEDSFCVDASSVESLISPRTTGILPVHVFGEVCDVSSLENVARRHDLILICDAAHAFGCSAEGIPIGRFSKASVFSFHATKFINTFEGGAIVTDDDELAEKLRLMRNFGFSAEDEVQGLGTNAKMSEPCAAMGLTSIESMNDFIAINRAHYNQYKSALGTLHGIEFATQIDHGGSNFQYVVIQVDPLKAAISRDALYAVLRAEGALVRRYFYPGCHRSEPYRSEACAAAHPLPRTESLINRVLCLPTGAGLATDEISQLCELIRFVLGNARSIGERLAAD